MEEFKGNCAVDQAERGKQGSAHARPGGGGVLAELEFYPQRNGKLLANFKQRMNMTGLRFTKKKRLVHIVLKIGHSGIHL